MSANVAGMGGVGVGGRGWRDAGLGFIFLAEAIEPVETPCNQSGSGFASGFLDFTQLWLVMRIMMMVTKQ